MNYDQMNPEQLQREADASMANQKRYGHLVGTLTPRDRSEAGQRERERVYRLANPSRPAHSMVSQQASSSGPNAKYISEYRAEPTYGKAMTEAEYVSMRRVDDGLDSLMAVPS